MIIEEVRVFEDRTDAGRRLGAVLADMDLLDPVVLALPRGGVPVAAEVSRHLDAPLDVLVARKIGAPGHPEFGIGAVAEGGVRIADPLTLERLGVDEERFARLAEVEEEELDRRVARYRGDGRLTNLQERDVPVVDDGLATGVTAGAALVTARRLGARRLVLAVPVAAPDSARRLAEIADRVVTLEQPDELGAVGRWYRRFDQTSDREVIDILNRSRAGPSGYQHLERSHGSEEHDETENRR